MQLLLILGSGEFKHLGSPINKFNIICFFEVLFFAKTKDVAAMTSSLSMMFKDRMIFGQVNVFLSQQSQIHLNTHVTGAKSREEVVQTVWDRRAPGHCGAGCW